MEDPTVDPCNLVNTQITDGVTQATAHVVGLGPAVAAVNAYLGATQAQTVLFANMVNQQQQLALTAMTVTTRNVATLIAARRNMLGGGASLKGNTGSQQGLQHSAHAFAMSSDGTSQHPYPVVT
jgi:hypothetical protein